MTNDSTGTTGEKIDYYSILKRRKRTVDSFVAEFGLVSLEDLDKTLSELGKEYQISEDFRRLAILALPPTPTPIKESGETVTDFVSEPVSDVDVDHVQKTKKRSKKEN